MPEPAFSWDQVIQGDVKDSLAVLTAQDIELLRKGEVKFVAAPHPCVPNSAALIVLYMTKEPKYEITAKLEKLRSEGKLYFHRLTDRDMKGIEELNILDIELNVTHTTTLSVLSSRKYHEDVVAYAEKHDKDAAAKGR